MLNLMTHDKGDLEALVHHGRNNVLVVSSIPISSLCALTSACGFY
jgi:hypothetical protein